MSRHVMTSDIHFSVDSEALLKILNRYGFHGAARRAMPAFVTSPLSQKLLRTLYNAWMFNLDAHTKPDVRSTSITSTK